MGPTDEAGARRGMSVVVCGGGVAGLEALMALRHLGEDKLELTLVAPEPEFTYRPLTVEEPFNLRPAERRALEPIAAEFDARFVQGSLSCVLPDEHSVELSDGAKLGYDALVVCVGGKPRPAYRNATTFDASAELLRIDELIETSRGGRIAFVVAPGVSWPLPIYELALMTERRARSPVDKSVTCVVVTPESAPLIMFGPAASYAVTTLLEARRIELETGVYAHESDQGELVLTPGGRRLDASRIVALPVIDGPAIAGLPTDDKGFIPIDEHARVRGVKDVYAAGDGTNFPIKQGGLATQQADAAAEHIASRAGAEVEPQPFRPVLRGKLLTGDASLHLRHEAAGGGASGVATEDYLWWPPHKVAGRYLAAWLAQKTPHELDAPQRPLDVEVALPYEWHKEPMALDPYGPLGVE
jgi:sulfide:quinone oxidoreductase